MHFKSDTVRARLDVTHSVIISGTDNPENIWHEQWKESE